MIAAVYARKSTDQNGVADEAKSVTRQIDHAKAYAARKGWAVADEFVFVDDGISGAEFANRPGFVRLMNALKPRPSFQVLIMSEESRLGREAIETAYALKQLVTAGVRVFFYLEDRERTLDSPTDKIMMSLTAFADELEREKARQRTTDAMARMAKAGHVTGGRVFGYDNHRTERGHVERRINEAEAEVVRRIFNLARDGAGLRAIAKRLNAEGAPVPRAQQGRPKAWAPSSVREVLHRPLYHGIIIWGRTKKRDQWGQARRKARPASDWVAVPAPELRIVHEDLWRAVQDRIENARLIYVRSTNGQLWGRPPSGVAAKHLLAGLARCGACGGSLVAVSRAHGTGKQRRREHRYACSSFHLRGSSVCSNGLEVRMSAADDAVLAALERDVLDAELIDGVVQRVLSRMQPAAEARETQRASLERQLRTIEAEIARFTDAIAAGGGNVASVVAALKSRDDRRQELVRELEGLTRPSAPKVNQAKLESEVRARLADWRELLRKQIPQARQIVRKLISDRITFTPDLETRSYTFSAPGTLARFLAGLVVAKGLASPTEITPFTLRLPVAA